MQMQLSKKRKPFSQFFVPFLAFTSKFKHFKKNLIAIANLFSKLQTVKDLVRPLPKKRCLRTSALTVNMLRHSKHF